MPKILPIVRYPEPILNQKCSEVDILGSRSFLDELIRNMIETARVHGGYGLAAPQVGIPLRIFVARAWRLQYQAFINPEIIDVSMESRVMLEGCLSIPGLAVPIKRPTYVLVRNHDLSGEAIEQDYVGAPARIIQHEMDHLDGTLIKDYEGSAHYANRC